MSGANGTTEGAEITERKLTAADTARAATRKDRIAEIVRLLDACDAREKRLMELMDDACEAGDAAAAEDAREIGLIDRENDRFRNRLIDELQVLRWEEKA